MTPLPGWESLESVSRVHGWFEIAGIVCLALLVLAESFTFIYGRRKDALASAKERAAAEKRNQEAQQTETRHETELAKVREQVSLTSADSERLKQRAKEAERGVAELQKQQVPRGLTAEQTRHLIGVAVPFQGQKISVVCILGDTEGRAFAAEFAQVFRSEGWVGAEGVNQAIYDVDPVGVEVTVNDQEVKGGGQPPAAVALIQALDQLGLIRTKTLFLNARVPVGLIEFRVGKRPG